MAQGTVAHFANRAPLTGTGSRNHLRLGEWKIGTLLTACFAAIVLLMIVGDVIAVLQLHRVDTRASRFYQADQKSLAIMHVYLDIVTLRDTLTGLARDQNPHEFASRATALRDNFLRDVTQAQRALSAAPDATQDPTILIRLGTVRAALPSQVDTMLELVKTGDWQAIRFRLAGQVPPLIGLSSSLVADVEQAVAQERARALESVQRTRRQLYLVLSITALLMLLMAAMLGWYATRRISRPLTQLGAGVQALARGEFGYEVELRGDDELADVARAFNYAAQQLHKLYDVVKRSEAHLTESNARLEEAQRITHVGYWEWDFATDCLIWSDETYRIFGLRPQERPMNVDALREMIHPEDRDRVFREKEQAITSGVCYDVEHRIVRPSGEVRVLNSTLAVKKDESSRPTRFYGTVQDITDRKRAEEELRRSQFYLSEGQRLAHMGSWAFNPAGFFDYWSEELFRIYGLDPQRGAPTLEQYLATVHPADRDFMAETIRRMHAERSGCDVKKRIVRPDGELRYIRCVGIPVVEGEVLKGFLGTAMDITDQELLTQESERRQAYLAEAQRLTHTGTWAWNVGTDERFWSEETFRIFEIDPVKLKPDWSHILDRVHPEDRASLEQRKKMESTQTEWAESEADFRIVVSDGKIKHLHSIAHPVMDASDQIIEIIGTVMDVTERKRVEDSLRRSESHLAEAQKLTHTGSWTWRLPDRNAVEVSEEWYRICGFDPAEGPPTWEECLERVHPEDRLKWKSTIERAIMEKADSRV